MRGLLITIMILAVGPFSAAQDVGRFEEVTAGNFFGFGARQMGMGGAGIASSLDGAALYYNPAALARIHRIEFQVGLTHQKYSNESSQAANRYPDSLELYPLIGFGEIDQTKTRLGSLNLTVPVPTYRGSLVVAFGVNRVVSFDRSALLDVLDRNPIGQEVATYEKEFETQGLYLYSGGAGVDISPNVSVGLALNVYSGKRKITFDYRYGDETNAYGDAVMGQITEDYIGAAFKGGLLVRPNSRLSVGLTVETPVDWQVEQSWFEEGYYGPDDDITTYQESGKVEYDLTRPFIFGAGVAYRINTLTLTGDIEYADWSQLAYGDSPLMEIKNDSLPLFYRDVFNLRLGAEYQLPSAGLALRGGIFYTPLANDKGLVYDETLERYVLEDIIEDDRLGFTLGLSWLIDRVLLLETAYVRGGFKRNYTAYNGITAARDDGFDRLYATLSYRY